MKFSDSSKCPAGTQQQPIQSSSGLFFVTAVLHSHKRGEMASKRISNDEVPYKAMEVQVHSSHQWLWEIHVLVLKCDMLATSEAPRGKEIYWVSSCPWANLLFIVMVILINEIPVFAGREKANATKSFRLTVLFINCQKHQDCHVKLVCHSWEISNIIWE